MTLRLRGSKTELEEMGEDVSDMATTTSQLQAKLLALTGGQVDIMLDANTFKNSTQILREMADAWEDMNDIQRASALELMGGKRQANVLSALIQNFDTVEDVIETSANSAGSALEENEKYLDSIQGKIDQFTNSLQTMWSNALESDVVKLFIDLGTALIKVVDNFGLLKSLLMVIGTYKIKKNFGGDLFGSLFGSKKETSKSIKEMKQSIEDFKKARDKAAEELANRPGSKSKQKNLNVAQSNLDAYEKSFGQQIKAYEEYNEKLVAAQEKLAKAQSKLDNYKKNGNKDGVVKDSTVKSYTDQVNSAQKEVDELTGKLKTAEDQTIKTGNAGMTAGQKIKSGFISGAKAVGKFAKETAMSMAYMYIITTVIDLVSTGISKLIEMITDAGESFEDLHNKFEEARGEVEAVESEIKNLETELDTTNEQMEDLLALDSLTFVEQEELNRLRSVSEELQHQIELKQQLQGSLQKGANDATLVAADKYMDTSFANEKTRTEVEEEGAETGGFWGKLAGIAIAIGSLVAAPFTGGWSLTALPLAFGAESIGAEIGSASAGSDYDAEESVKEAIANMNTQRDQLIRARDEALAAYADGSGSKEAYESAEQELTQYNANLAKAITQISEYRNAIMSDTEDATIEQLEQAKAWGDMIDAYNIEMGGKGAKEAAINRVFSDGALLDEFEKEKEAIDGYVEALKNGDESAAQSIANLINGNQDLKDAFSAKTLNPQDAIDYFTKLGSDARFDTIEGKTEEIRKATEKLGVAFNNIGRFMKGDKVDTTAIAEYFQGTTEATRKEIARLVKNIHDGEITVQQAMKSFAAFGMLESWKIIETEVSELNTNVFKELGDEISGIINTVSELSAAFEDVSKSIDLVSQAEAEMAYSGHLSIETALQLMESTDDWNKVLEIENGNIKLVAGAEDVLIQTKLDLIKTNLQTALSTVEAQLAQLDATGTSADMATTIEESTNLAVTELAANMAFAAKMAEAYTRAMNGENINMDKYMADAEAAKQDVRDKTNYVKNAAEKIGREDLEKERDRLKAMIGIVETGDTRAEFESNYSSDEVSGGNADKDSAEEDLFQKEMDYWENRIGANQARYEQLQNEIDLLEAKGQKADASFYEEQIKLENKRLSLLNQQKNAAKTHLATLAEGSEEWWEVANTLNDIESELDGVTASILDLQDAIAEIDTYKFEEFNTRLDNLVSKLDTIANLIAPDGEEDWFDDEGQWTEKGVAVLGKNVQALEFYKQGLAETEKELDKYNQAYSENTKAYYEGLGIHSEQEWYDKTEELISQQYDFAESISDTEQSIVDMYESNIDAVEEYAQTLVDSYNDYIDGVKEALDAERDLFEFKKNVQKQSKDIAAIERRIASLSGSTNASDVAERRKLEAQLYESRESLNDTYYDHAKNAQSEALDSEAQAYEESMTKFVEGLRTSLEQASLDMDLFLGNVTAMVSLNAGAILTEYQNTGLELDPALTTPWVNAKNAIGNYSGDALGLMNQWTQGGFFSTFPETVKGSLTSPWTVGSNAADSFKTSVETAMSNVVSNIATNVKTASGELSKLYQQIQDTAKKATEVGSGGYTPTTPAQTSAPTPTVTPEPTVKLRGLMQTSREMILGSKSFVDENTETINGVKYYRDSKTGYYYKISDLNSKRKYDGGRTTGWAIPKGTWFYTKHAKGTTGTTRDEWAITDEPQFGDELVLVPGKDGNLSFMRKGTGVVPADLTANLMEWGQFTPDAMNLGGGVNVNMINNAVNKPEFNFEFDALVKAENITEETLPAVKKLVTQELNRFTKELNYALKGKGAR